MSGGEGRAAGEAGGVVDLAADPRWQARALATQAAALGKALERAEAATAPLASAARALGDQDTPELARMLLAEAKLSTEDLARAAALALGAPSRAAALARDAADRAGLLANALALAANHMRRRVDAATGGRDGDGA